jgi:hypothetical protein
MWNMAKKNVQETKVNDGLQIRFVHKGNGPERLVCEVELILPAPLDGLKLVGFSLWQGADGSIFVTLPSRAFGAGSDRKFFDYVRGLDGNVEAVKALKAKIVDAFHAKSDDTEASAEAA